MVNRMDDYKMTPVHVAAWSAGPAVMAALIECRPDPHLKSSNLIAAHFYPNPSRPVPMQFLIWPAVFIAAREQRLEVLEAMLARPDLYDVSQARQENSSFARGTLLEYVRATHGASSPVTQMVLNSGQCCVPFLGLCPAPELDALLAAGVNVNAARRRAPHDTSEAALPSGWTALHAACAGGRVANAQALLDRGALVEAVTTDAELPNWPAGITPLFACCLLCANHEDRLATIHLLLASGANASTVIARPANLAIEGDNAAATISMLHALLRWQHMPSVLPVLRAAAERGLPPQALELRALCRAAASPFHAELVAALDSLAKQN